MTDFDSPDASPGRVVLSTIAPASQLTLVYASDPSQTIAVGGWQASERFGRPAAKWWKAPGDGSLSLELALDQRLVGGPDIPRRLEVLAAMGQRVPGGSEPPLVFVTSTALPQAAGIEWEMQTLTLGTPIERDGVLVRQAVSITLEPHQPVNTIDEVKQGRTRDATTGKRRRRVIQSRPHDTLRVIAVRQLGSVGEWKQIREWNKSLAKVDPDAPLRTGTRVVLY